MEKFAFKELPQNKIWHNMLNSIYFHTLYEDPNLVSLTFSNQNTPMYEFVLPESKDKIISTCINDNEIFHNIYVSPTIGYYVFKIQNEYDQDHKYIYISYKASPDNCFTKVKDLIMRRHYKSYLQCISMKRKVSDGIYSYVISSPISVESRKIINVNYMETSN